MTALLFILAHPLISLAVIWLALAPIADLLPENRT